jgi:hypothetical protein
MRADRLLMGAWAVATGVSYLTPALGSPVLYGGGVLSRCVPACPENVLQVGSAPALLDSVLRWNS